METQRQFTVFLDNKPGRLANLCSAIAKEKINIEALTVMDSKEHSVLRLVVDNIAATHELLRKTGTPYNETEVVMIDVKHQPGAIAHICERLAAEHVNIDYMYCSSGAKNGRTVAVLKATPTEKVKQVLDAPAPRTTRNVQRRPPVRK